MLLAIKGSYAVWLEQRERGKNLLHIYICVYIYILQILWICNKEMFRVCQFWDVTIMVSKHN